MHEPSYYLNEVKTAQVTTHETYGEHKWEATLVEFFGNFSIILTSYSAAKKIDCVKHSYFEAEREFDRFVNANTRKVAA